MQRGDGRSVFVPSTASPRSSFAVASGIVTNRHLASGSNSLQMSTWMERTLMRRYRGFVRTGPGAVERIPSPRGTASAPLASADPSVGTAVWAQVSEGDQLTVAPGHILDYSAAARSGSQRRHGDQHAIEPATPVRRRQQFREIVGVVYAIHETDAMA